VLRDEHDSTGILRGSAGVLHPDGTWEIEGCPSVTIGSSTIRWATRDTGMPFQRLRGRRRNREHDLRHRAAAHAHRLHAARPSRQAGGYDKLVDNGTEITNTVQAYRAAMRPWEATPAGTSIRRRVVCTSSIFRPAVDAARLRRTLRALAAHVLLSSEDSHVTAVLERTDTGSASCREHRRLGQPSVTGTAAPGLRTPGTESCSTSNRKDDLGIDVTVSYGKAHVATDGRFMITAFRPDAGVS